MHLQDPYVPTQADHLGYLSLTIGDQDGTSERVIIRAETRLMNSDQNEVAARSGEPDYMPADWYDRAIALVQELRTATAEIQGVAASPPDIENEENA